MRTKILTPAVALLALTVAACGSSSSSSSAVKAGSSPVRHGPAPRLYHVALAGTGGAPAGKGTAVIAIHGTAMVCWRFAHLHGFTSATRADIHASAIGRSGKVVLPLSTGPRLHHKGCVPVTATLAKAIEHGPAGYYVSIDSAAYPRGAVRGQL